MNDIEEHMEILEDKMWVQKDDLGDACMLMDMADSAKGDGNTEAASWFHHRAKERCEHYAADSEAVKKQIEKMRTLGHDAPDSIQAHMLDMLMAEQKERAEHLKHRIESFAD